MKKCAAYNNVPAELRLCKAWLVWKLVRKPGKAKPDKIPYYVSGGPRTGTQGNPEDRKKLATFSDALACFSKGRFDGIGFAVLPDWGFVFLDFDNCAKDKDVDPQIIRLAAYHTYTEFSPSGKGVRAVMKGEAGDHKSYTTPEAWGFEVFSSKGFVTLTGNVLDECDLLGASEVIAPLSEGIKELISNRFGDKKQDAQKKKEKSDNADWFDYVVPKLGLSLDQLKDHLSYLDPDMGRGGWLKVGAALHHETDGDEEGRELFTSWSRGDIKHSDKEVDKVCAKYIEGDPEKAWKSFHAYRPGRIVTAATIIWMANKERAKNEVVLNRHNHMDNAQKFLNMNFTSAEGPSLIHMSGSWYKHLETHYVEEEEDSVRAALWKWMNSCYKQESFGRGTNKTVAIVPFEPAPTNVNGTMDALKAITHLEKSQAPSWLYGVKGPNPAYLISLKNGLLDIFTQKLLVHSQKLFNLNTLPYEYVEQEEPTEWLKFLRSVFLDDKESQDTLQEIFGYLLTTDTQLQKIFLILGPKRSGKGTIGRILKNLVGFSNFTSPSFTSLGGTFGMEPLIGKLVAVVPDARVSRAMNKQIVVERLLMISGEDNVTVDRKNKTSWTGILSARFVVMTNEIPRLGDSCGALASRFIVISMKESFFGREDPELTTRLTKELPKIFRWALTGLIRLRRRGYFVQPRTGQEAADALAALNSPITVFVRECCEIDSNATVGTDELYCAWTKWSVENKEWTGSKEDFGRKLKEAFPSISRRQGPRSDDRLPIYSGIRLIRSVSFE